MKTSFQKVIYPLESLLLAVAKRKLELDRPESVRTTTAVMQKIDQDADRSGIPKNNLNVVGIVMACTKAIHRLGYFAAGVC